MNVADMREALKERPVRRTTAAVRILDESSRNLQINKIKHFSEYHNFQYDESGLRAWTAYAVGPGKFYPLAVVVFEASGTYKHFGKGRTGVFRKYGNKRASDKKVSSE